METARIAFAPEASFVLGAIELDHLLVECALVGGIEIGQGVGDLAVHVLDRFEHTFAEKALFVAVAQLDRFVLAG